MGKFMGQSGLCQFSGAEFKNRGYTGVGWDFQPHFHNFNSRSGEGDQRINLKQEAREALAIKNALCYFVLLSERPGALMVVGAVCSLAYMVE